LTSLSGADIAIVHAVGLRTVPQAHANPQVAEAQMTCCWDTDKTAILNGVKIEFISGNYSEHKTTDDRIVVLKPKGWFDLYKELFSNLNGGKFNFVELGIFEGGSALLFAEDFPDAKIAAFDLRSPNPSVLRHVETMGFSDRVKLRYNTSQSDAKALSAGIESAFNGDQVHLVIDDASHNYEHSRNSFEILFPLLAPGGKYVIEDWGWAHWPIAVYDSWGGVALSSLVMELVMAVASNPALCSRLEVRPGMAILTKGTKTATDRINFTSLLKTKPRTWQPLRLESAET
jgi:cephalosporin hydroxylase